MYLVQLPPPVHGVSLTNQYVYESRTINHDFVKHLVRLCFAKEIAGLRRLSPGKFFQYFAVLFRLIAVLVSKRPSFVYFSFMPVGIGFLRDLSFLFVIKMFRRKVILHLNNRGIIEKSATPVYRMLYKWALHNTNIIHVTRSLVKEEIEPLHIRKCQIFVVPNTVETIQPIMVEKNESEFRILFISNLFPEKGLLVLLETIQRLRSLHSNMRLDIYGFSRGRKEEKFYKDFVEKNHLHEIVTLHGPITGPEKEKVFRKAELFVFPSWFREECFPLALLEAMQASVPIVATRIGGVPEMVRDDIDAKLTEPGDVDGLTAAIDEMIRNRELRLGMASHARQRFQENYAMPLFEQRMRQVFETVLNPERL